MSKTSFYSSLDKLPVINPQDWSRAIAGELRCFVAQGEKGKYKFIVFAADEDAAVAMIPQGLSDPIAFAVETPTNLSWGRAIESHQHKYLVTAGVVLSTVLWFLLLVDIAVKVAEWSACNNEVTCVRRG